MAVAILGKRQESVSRGTWRGASQSAAMILAEHIPEYEEEGEEEGEEAGCSSAGSSPHLKTHKVCIHTAWLSSSPDSTFPEPFVLNFSSKALILLCLVLPSLHFYS